MSTTDLKQGAMMLQLIQAVLRLVSIVASITCIVVTAIEFARGDMLYAIFFAVLALWGLK